VKFYILSALNLDIFPFGTFVPMSEESLAKPPLDSITAERIITGGRCGRLVSGSDKGCVLRGKEGESTIIEGKEGDPTTAELTDVVVEGIGCTAGSTILSCGRLGLNWRRSTTSETGGL
jgi:hypothetical protein